MNFNLSHCLWTTWVWKRDQLSVDSAKCVETPLTDLKVTSHNQFSTPFEVKRSQQTWKKALKTIAEIAWECHEMHSSLPPKLFSTLCKAQLMLIFQWHSNFSSIQTLPNSHSAVLGHRHGQVATQNMTNLHGKWQLKRESMKQSFLHHMYTSYKEHYHKRNIHFIFVCIRDK